MQCDQILSLWLIIILSSYLVFGEILSLLWQICQGIGQFYIASNYQNRTCNQVTMAVGTCSIDCYTYLLVVKAFSCFTDSLDQWQAKAIILGCATYL